MRTIQLLLLLVLACGPAAAASPDGFIGEPTACVPDSTTLCIDDVPGDRRFRVRMRFETELNGGAAGDALARPLTALGLNEGGVLWFFDNKNPEVLIKVLDGCDVNGHFWVFAAAATSLGYTLTVEDTRTFETRVYTNPDIHPAATVTDIRAFATCSERANVAQLPTPELMDSVETDSVETDSEDVELLDDIERLVGDELPEGMRQGSCVPDATTLCLDDEPRDRRWRVTLRFDTTLGAGASGDAHALPLQQAGLGGGVMWFFSARNPEVIVKVLNGCEINNRFWVFAAAATSVGFEMTIEDTITHVPRTWVNPDRNPAATITDTSAFATCDDTPF